MKLKSYVKELIYFLIWLSGLPYLCRKRNQSKVTILLFHEFPSGLLGNRIIQFLSSAYNIISLDSLKMAIDSSSLNSLPKNSLVITLDDARVSNMNLVELVKKYNFVPTIYVSCSEERLDGKKFFNKEMIESTKHLFDFQAHTITHPDLTTLGQTDSYHEISESKRILEDWLDKPIYSFAYPYGRYTQKDVLLAKEAGFSHAMTVKYGLNDENTPVFELKRICLSDSPTVFEVKVKSSGVF